jgi:tRNA (guanine-N7-)-methyltransferase
MIVTGAVPQHRQIRSFVRREGRLTPGQERAFETLWQRFGIDWDSTAATDPETIRLLPEKLFARRAPCTLEIGFGDGEALLHLARMQPDRDFIGIEVHRPGVGHLLLRLEALSLNNVRILCADAVAVLNRGLVDNCLDRIQIFFPDPWPKKRHHKRRLLQPDFVALLARKLIAGGILHLATDWENYALQMLEILQQSDVLVNTTEGFAERPVTRPQTKFERRGLKLGHPVRDLIFRRC